MPQGATGRDREPVILKEKDLLKNPDLRIMLTFRVGETSKADLVLYKSLWGDPRGHTYEKAEEVNFFQL